VAAGALLAAVFALLVLVRLVAVAELGVVWSLGLLLDALLARALLWPALCRDLGRLAWWPRR
jgi:RND superfamily putative drug exporter